LRSQNPSSLNQRLFLLEAQRQFVEEPAPGQGPKRPSAHGVFIVAGMLGDLKLKIVFEHSAGD